MYSCSKGQRIAAIVDVRPFGQFRDDTKDAEFQFSDQPEARFPNGAFAGFVRPSGATGEFRSDGLAWTQKPGPGWGKPDQLSITAQPGGDISVRLINTPCGTMQAKRCEAAEPGRVPTCATELAQQGVKLYTPKTLNELAKVIAEQKARNKQ